MATISGAFSLGMRDLSSLKVTSKIQCNEFSIYINLILIYQYFGE